MSCPISVYGVSDQDVHLISKYLIQYEHLCFVANEESKAKVTEGEDISISRLLSIRTKYYTADLELGLYTISDTIGDNISEGCECCILVVSSSQEELNPKITAIGAQAMDSNIDIKLLVVLKDEDNASSVDSCRGDRVLWALDHSFEYIEIEKSAPTKGFNEREKDGLPRLMEALHTNMWTNMERLDPNAMKNSESSQDVSSKPTTVFSMPLLPQTSSENSSNDKQAVLEAEGVSVSRTLGYKGLLEETDDDDKVWDSFSTTIEAAKQLREEAVGGKLSDDARRKRAADLALQMCAMMDIGDDDDSDEED